jgi:hypothetical protein
MQDLGKISIMDIIANKTLVSESTCKRAFLGKKAMAEF